MKQRNCGPLGSRWIAGFAAALAISSPTVAFALKQPDNTVIPQGAGLQGLFNARMEQISALNDAQIVPQTFTPTCNLSFEVMQRNAGYKNSFGWYNVTGKKPLVSELFEFLKCSDPVGTKKTLNIKQEQAYKGGDVGFFEAVGSCPTPQTATWVFFSEPQYNPDALQQNPFIHLLIYNSTVTPKAFYFGWEDLLSGGDNDFDDLTVFVTGISCTGGGGACKTGLLGICAEGTLQCQTGMLKCLPLVEPSVELCDGLDNDCNDVTDDGNLCPAEHVCDKGSCVPFCGAAEFPCPPGTVCNATGLCVDEACLEVTCPANKKCVEGQCVAPCDGVACPYGQICLVGACFDPCTKLTCDADQVCSLGACIEKCQCAGCAATESCEPSGLCLPTACVGVMCAEGTHCDASGNCVDDCAGAVCPKGEVCALGDCVPDPNPGTGGAGGATTSGGIFDGGSDASGGSTASNSAGATTGGGLNRRDGGCACELNPGAAAGASGRGLVPWHGWLFGLAALAASLGRRAVSRASGAR
ncbi:MAG: DUF4114 domain-containing protein [Myxococcales bacterium]|nr:DUF4114 domain-containing protein [Myxococcales bacterium]